MQQQQTQSLITIVSKLRVFHGLSLNETALLLKVCASRSYTAAEIIYQAGEPSREMFILLQGKLKAVSKSGTELGDILPGTCCGEMGMFTGHNRSATVVAIDQSMGFAIARGDLLKVFKADVQLQAKVQQNIIMMLCERLEEADINIDSRAGELKRVKDEQGMGPE